MILKQMLGLVLGFFIMVSFGCGSNNSRTSVEPAERSVGPVEPLVEIVSGQIIDSVIQGLDYQSASRSGFTDAQGTFFHGVGETVTFSIGNLIIGTTQGKAITTLVDLVEGATGVDNRRVKNIARLLQSLDSDCNVRNGIQITSQIRAEVSPLEIDFDQPSIAFGSDPAIADLFARLNAAGAFTGGCAAALRPESVAKEHLFKSINDTWRLAGGSVDIDGDGVADAVKRIVRDDRGRVTELDDPILYDAVMYTEYDNEDRPVLIRYDWGRNGSIDQIVSFGYAADGRHTDVEYDDNGDGVFDWVESYDYDQFGREAGHLSHHYGTGQYYRYTTAYNADGNVAIEEVDADDDGTVDYRSQYSYVEGKLTRVDYVEPTRGSTAYYAYDGDNLISESSDWDNDGTLDWRTESTYDGRGNRLTIKQYSYQDNGGNPTWFLDSEETFAYDQNDLFIEQTIVFHYSNGNPDETWHQAVTRDANGNITRVELTTADGETQIQTFSWEEQSIPPAFDIYVPAGGPLSFS
jgi:hypothetical protein